MLNTAGKAILHYCKERAGNRKPGAMKSAILMVFMVLFADVAVGQKTQPEATPALMQAGEEIPTPSGTPEPQVAPDLLPESNRLPAETPNLRLPSPPILKPEGSTSTESPP